MNSFVFVAIITTLIVGCENDQVEVNENLRQYETENVFVVIVDGARYSETWGDSTHQYIPHMANDLLPKGIINTRFYNNGFTYTNAGHVAISTGNYQLINNKGTDLPENPSYFQHWLKTKSESNESTWVIGSKGKLQILGDCKLKNWSGEYNPRTNCGVDGLGVDSEYRNDSLTYKEIEAIIDEHHPRLVLINFREPDFSAHKGDWEGYLKGIRDTDRYVANLINNVENSPHYQGKTTYFVTNDHGRHLDNVLNGYVSHGDDCPGCRHVNFFACGPDFKRNLVIDKNRELIDIPSTIAELLHFEMPTSKGEIMEELFIE